MNTCLRRAGIGSGELDLLVNVGVYRERGLGEPALAALIQEDVSANPGHPPVGEHGTFSFDLGNGACGVLTGAHVTRGFLESGAARRGIVVASDSGPDPVHARHVPYAEIGGALLLGWDEGVPGLVAHRTATFPEFEGLAQAHWEWVEHPRLRPRSPGGHNSLQVMEKPGYHDRAADCAAEMTREFLADNAVGVGDVDLLLATHAPGFADAVADMLGIAHSRVVHLGEDMAAAHSAEPIAAVSAAMHDGRWADSRTILMVAAGAGITVAASLYRH